VVAENLVANWLMVASDGRLSPFRPIADDGGIDLLVYDRETRRTLLLQVKSRTRTKAMTAKGRNVRFNVRIATFKVRPDFYIFGVLLDDTMQTPEAIWLIPSKRIEEGAIRTRKDNKGNPSLLVVTCNPSKNSHDQWSSFKAHTPKELVNVISNQLNSA